MSDHHIELLDVLMGKSRHAEQESATRQEWVS
jgi:hypothetical protein